MMSPGIRRQYVSVVTRAWRLRRMDSTRVLFLPCCGRANKAGGDSGRAGAQRLRGAAPRRGARRLAVRRDARCGAATHVGHSDEDAALGVAHDLDRLRGRGGGVRRVGGGAPRTRAAAAAAPRVRAAPHRLLARDVQVVQLGNGRRLRPAGRNRARACTQGGGGGSKRRRRLAAAAHRAAPTRRAANGRVRAMAHTPPPPRTHPPPTGAGARVLRPRSTLQPSASSNGGTGKVSGSSRKRFSRGGTAAVGAGARESARSKPSLSSVPPLFSASLTSISRPMRATWSAGPACAAANIAGVRRDVRADGRYRESTRFRRGAIFA